METVDYLYSTLVSGFISVTRNALHYNLSKGLGLIV